MSASTSDVASEPAGSEAVGVGRASEAAPSAGRLSSRVAGGLIAVFRAYQLARANRVSPCRFTPTCSQYAIEAVARHGAGRGVRLALRRLGRCRPGGPSGYDPIPE